MNQLINKAYRTAFIIIGVVLMNTFSFITYNNVSASIVLVASLFFTLTGCYIWTKLKSRHWAFMFWGILAPIGLLGISLLEDRTTYMEN
jgi:hypothetical protein